MLSFAEQRKLGQMHADTTDDAAILFAALDPKFLAMPIKAPPVDHPQMPADAAVEFLRALDPSGRHNLVAIAPGRRLEGRTFEPGDWSGIREWVDARDGRSNLYYSVNEPSSDAPHDKLSKRDIASIRAVHVDIDPNESKASDLDGKKRHVEEERLRLKRQIADLNAAPVPPSMAVDSGGGVQLIWRLSQKLDAQLWTDEAEAQNLGLIEALGGDRSTQDISRLLRLPGTLNLPGPDKVAKGRTQRRAGVMTTNAAVYGLDEIARSYEPKHVTERTDKNPEIDQLKKAVDLGLIAQASDYSDLPAALRNRFDAALSSSVRLQELWASGIPHGKDKSGSAGRFELADWLKLNDFTLNEFGSLLWVWDHATRPGKPLIHEFEDDELRRDIARCWAKARAPLDPAKFFTPIDDEESGTPDSDNPFQTPNASQKVKLLDLISFDDAVASALEASAKPLVKGFLDQGALSVLYGESNVGKTFVAMDIAFNVAAGLDWAGRRSAHMSVVYVAAEGGRGARRRLAAIARQRGGEAPVRPRFHLYPGSVNLLRADADLVSLIETVRSVENVGLVVIDTLSRALAGGDENSSTDMGALVKNVDRLRQATDAHVMLVHHSGKDRARGARGHSLLRAATDTEIEIADNEITVTKQRDIDGNFRRAFVLDIVELGKDSDGDAITSCIVRLVSQAERPSSQPTAVEDEILALLDRLQEADPEAKGFETDVIVRACRDAGKTMPGETIRTRLRNMETKRLVEKPKRGLWKRKSDNLSGGIASTVSVFLTDLDE